MFQALVRALIDKDIPDEFRHIRSLKVKYIYARNLLKTRGALFSISHLKGHFRCEILVGREEKRERCRRCVVRYAEFYLSDIDD